MSIDRPTASEVHSGAIRHPEPPIAPPGVFAVHDEGDGISALYLRAFPTPALGDLLLELGAPVTELVELSARWGVRSRVRSLAEVQGRAELELVHSPDDRPLDHSVLVNPAQALPAGGPGRFALHRAYDGHTIVFSRDPAVLAATLGVWLVRWTAAGGLRHPPTAPQDALRSLAAVVPAEVWREARLETHRRHCVLAVTTHGTDEADTERWVARPGGEWRTGWSW